MSNVDTINNLTPDIDIQGRTLEVGCRVRSFDFPLFSQKYDTFLGMDTKGERVSYVEGILVRFADEMVEGCKRYEIKIEREVCTREYGQEPKVLIHRAGQLTYPPQNGTPSLGGLKTFSVIRVDNENT